VGGARPGARWWRETVGTDGLAATTGVHGQKTPWWPTCGPSAAFNLIHFFPKLQLQNS
jgi:hypothetical protein